MAKQCPKTFHEVFLKYFLFFIISWPLEALGLFPNCRSHFSDQDGINESFWNLQNTSFMTKQCPKTSQNIFRFLFLKYSIFCIISWALQALGPLPHCRSHFSDLDGINESSRNLQNTSFMTKQCSNPNPVSCVFPYNWCLVIWEPPPEERSCLNYHKVLYCYH